MRLAVYSLVLAFGLSLFCDQPQRQGWISFEAFSNMDHIATVFEDIDPSLTKRSLNSTVDGVTYSLTDFRIAAWYNDIGQKEVFVNESVARVIGGYLTISFSFNYSYEGIKGTAHGSVLADDLEFTKQIYLDNGALAWDVMTIKNITISHILSITSSNPPLSATAKSVYQNILSNRVETHNTLLQDSIDELNVKYGARLKEFLRSEDIVVVQNAVYRYGDYVVNYTSAVVEQRLSNVGFKGLKYTCIFELENYTRKCVDLPKEYNPEYGGVQDLIAFPWLEANLMYILHKGFFNVTLGGIKWETPIFQFFMGDLANVMPEARKAPPSSEVTGKCQWGMVFNSTFVDYFNAGSIYVSVPLNCTLSNQQRLLQNFTFEATFVVQLQLARNAVKTRVKKTGVMNLQFQSSGAYVVEDTKLAEKYIRSVLAKLEGQSTFGDGFNTTVRKAPVLRITRDYFVMFDASEM